MLVAAPVVGVDMARGVGAIDHEGVGVRGHRASASPPPYLLDNDGAAPYIHRDVAVMQLDGDHAPARLWHAAMRLPEVEPLLTLGQVNLGLLHPRPVDRPHKDVLAEKVLVVDVLEGELVAQVVEPQRPHDGQPGEGPLREEGVPHRYQLVASADLVPDHRGDLVPEHPWLAALRLQVGMPPVERIPNAELVPSPEKLGLGVVEEAGDIRSGEGYAAETQGQQHGHRPREVVPSRLVVAGPYRPVPVGAGEEGARQDEWPHIGSALQLPLHRGHVMVEAVDVVHVAVLHFVAGHVALVQVVSRHGHLWTVEDAWLVHIIPCVQILPVVGVVVHGEELRPLGPHVRVAEISVRGGAWPTPTVVLAAVLRLGEQVAVPQRSEDTVAVIFLDVRIDDRDQLPLRSVQTIQELVRLREVSRVPSEVLLTVGVLDVQPQDIIWDVVLVELAVDGQGVGDIYIVPP
mmetsp:Transcript_73215/g.205608  ORF Transcript_73215/g.205608 Transcript_73215/m.205608 type:complete len:460 (+) Transcript_73215:270-1649(+)